MSNVTIFGFTHNGTKLRWHNNQRNKFYYVLKIFIEAKQLQS